VFWIVHRMAAVMGRKVILEYSEKGAQFDNESMTLLVPIDPQGFDSKVGFVVHPRIIFGNACCI
jgi:hypothetical protein